MPDKDEFGGVAVDESDEFGGVPIEEGPSEADAQEILNRPALPAWEGAGEDSLTAYNPSFWQRFRQSRPGHALMGPTEAEKIAASQREPGSMLGSPGSDTGIVPLAEKMLQMTSVPPQLSKPIRTATDPLIEALPPVPKGIVKGGRELALTLPIAPFGPAAKVALPVFAGELAASFPEQKRAYDEAIRDGRYEEAAQIATQVVGGSALLGLGSAHEFRSKPVVPGPVPEPGQPTPEGASLPSVVEKTVGPDGNPIEVLEINKQKKTALVRPEGQPDAAPSVLPLSEVTTKEIETKGPNASSESKAATVYGDMRPPAGEGEGQVPAEEGERGIQSQAGGGIRQAEGEGGKISLAPEEKALTDAAAESNRKQGLDSEIEVVSDQPKKGETPDIAYIEDGKIKLNAPEFRKWLTRIRPEQRAEAVEALMNEEGIHLSVRKAIGDPAVADLWKSLTSVEQNLVKRSYFGKGWKKAEALSDAQMGHEYMRRVIQWGMSVNPREVVASKGKGFEWITQKGIDVALKGIDAVRRTLPTESGRNVRAMLDLVETNLNAIKNSEFRQWLKETKGEKLSAKAGPRDYPVEVEDAEGNRKRAFFNGYYDLRPVVPEPMISVGYEKPGLTEGELSHGMVMPGEKVIGKIPSIEEWKAMPELPEKLSAKAEETADQVAKMSPEEFMKFSEERASTGGFTKVAHEIGRDAPSAEFAGALKRRADQFNKEFGENRSRLQAEPDIQKKITLMNKGASLSTRAQFFQEAHDYAIADPNTSGGQWAIKEGHVPKFGPYAKGNRITEAARYRQSLKEEKLSAKGPVGKAIDDLNNRRKAFGTIFRAGTNRKIMDQTIDGADNKANIVGQQMGNRLRIGTDKLRREATLAVVEAAGDPKKLNDFLTKAQAGGNEDAVRAVRYAQNNWAALQTDATRVKRILDGQISQEQNAGISTEYRDAYVPHIYDRDLLMGSGRPFVIAGGTGMGSGFKKGRTFDNIFDAIKAGYTPKTLDVADLVEHRVKVGQKIINRKGWAESLATLNDPTDGRPLSAPLIRKSRGPGQPGYEVAPSGYRPVEILPGVRTAIHEAYLPLFNALTGESAVSGSVPGKLTLEAFGAIKHGLLIFDTFHASRMMQRALAIAPTKFGPDLPTFWRDMGRKGRSLLEYSNQDLNRAIANRLITPEIAAWVRNNRANANLLMDSGLNVGRIQEALYTSVVRQIPGLGTFNKWVFEKLTRGALMEAGLIELERVSAAKPNVPRGTIARQVARDLNAYFGNLGRQGLFKSKSAQDVARLVALAPQWVESMARTEVKGAAQAVKGLTYDPVVHKTLLVGSIGKGVAQGLLAYFVGTQILNYVTRGHSTFQNPEDNRKFDAWIPDLTGKGHGFWLSPFSSVAELTHDMLRYSSKEPTKMEAATRIAGNKASPLWRAGKVLLTGRDYDGKQITDTWKRVKAAAFALAPTPIPLAPTLKGSAYPGQTQRQITASLGFKTEPAESATQQIVQKAKQFLIDTGKKKPVPMELSEDEPAYYKLRDLLRKDDEKGAQEMLAELRKTHSPKQIMMAMRNHVKRPFTGSRLNEAAFRNSLSPKDKGVYDKARDEQRQEYQQFLKLWYKQSSP